MRYHRTPPETLSPGDVVEVIGSARRIVQIVVAEHPTLGRTWTVALTPIPGQPETSMYCSGDLVRRQLVDRVPTRVLERVRRRRRRAA